MAAWRVLNQNGLKPSFTAGHSLGGYSAYVAAGTISFADAVRTVRNRGKYMQESVPVGIGAMAAVLGMEFEEVAAVCAVAAQGEVCDPANINSPDQIVVSGHKAAVERAAKLASERGAKRAVMLPVSAPFHSSLMKPAQDRLAGDLEWLTFRDPGVAVVCNVDAAPVSDSSSSRDALIRQVTGSVKWEQSMRWLISQGVCTFVEVGPGKVLCGLMRQIDRSKTCLSAGDEASLRKTVEHFAGVSVLSLRGFAEFSTSDPALTSLRQPKGRLWAVNADTRGPLNTEKSSESYPISLPTRARARRGHSPQLRPPRRCRRPWERLKQKCCGTGQFPTPRPGPQSR